VNCFNHIPQPQNGKKSYIDTVCKNCDFKRRLDNQNMVFAFSKFKANSVQTKDFNNKYRGIEEYMMCLARLFERFSVISQTNAKQLNSDPYLKKNLHYTEFDDRNDAINRVENILSEEYKFPSLQQFERQYYEVSSDNGSRIIGTLRDGYIFECLFLDPNHMICKDDCLNYEKKKGYNFPCLLDRKEIENADLSDTLILVNVLVEELKDGALTKEEFIEQIEPII
jgi:hypothetical protein